MFILILTFVVLSFNGVKTQSSLDIDLSPATDPPPQHIPPAGSNGCVDCRPHGYTLVGNEYHLDMSERRRVRRTPCCPETACRVCSDFQFRNQPREQLAECCRIKYGRLATNSPPTVEKDRGGEDAGPELLKRVMAHIYRQIRENTLTPEQRQSIDRLHELLARLSAEAAPYEEGERSVNDARNYFQADIDLTVAQAEEILENNGLKARLWQGAVIPYEFGNMMVEVTRWEIRKALEDIQRFTCIRFVENGPGQDRILFTDDGSGCSSKLGKVGGVQLIRLKQASNACLSNGIIYHEIMHALGIKHEQARMDRDDYVHLDVDNIVQDPGWRSQFYKDQTVDVAFGIKYDYGSVMHYESRHKDFTINMNKFVIVAKTPQYQLTMGQRVGPEFADVQGLNKVSLFTIPAEMEQGG